mmetsp:Transcript_82278/g.197306  ORF Transcript_82278/g.197306 Transcript_82278/m.197306 type:complete len:214 (+) Transcript_82278:633-1274(+)
MRVLLQEPKDVSVEDLCKKRACNRGPIVLRRRCNQADELPQVRDLGLHPFLLRRHEILDALLQLRLHRWLISADGKQEMVEAHVPTKCLVRCPSLTLHQEDHLGVHQLRKHVQDHRSVEAWLSRNRHLLWNLLLQRPGAESFELGFRCFRLLGPGLQPLVKAESLDGLRGLRAPRLPPKGPRLLRHHPSAQHLEDFDQRWCRPVEMMGVDGQR